MMTFSMMPSVRADRVLTRNDVMALAAREKNCQKAELDLSTVNKAYVDCLTTKCDDGPQWGTFGLGIATGILGILIFNVAGR